MSWADEKVLIQVAEAGAAYHGLTHIYLIAQNGQRAVSARAVSYTHLTLPTKRIV